MRRLLKAIGKGIVSAIDWTDQTSERFGSRPDSVSLVIDGTEDHTGQGGGACTRG